MEVASTQYRSRGGGRAGRTALAAAIIVAAGLVAYANGFTGIFAGLDAKESIRDNPHIRRLWPPSEAMSLDVLDETLAADPGAKGGTLVRRPLLSLTFALTYNLVGTTPAAFHAVNLAIHLLAGLALFGLLRRTLLLPGMPDGYCERATGLALAVAAVWVVHPLHTEAVTYIVQRAESLMGLLVLVTLYCAVRALSSKHAAWWDAGAVAACAFGMGVKETMVVTPVLVVAYDWLVVGKALGGTPAQILARRRRLYAGLAASWGVIAVLVLSTLSDVAHDFRPNTRLPYVLSQPGVLLHYLRLVVWPEPLHLYVNTMAYEVRPGVTPTARILAALVPVLALLAATLWAVWRRERLGYLGVFFFVVLAPTSTFVATSDVIQEHRMYLPSAAVIVLLVLAFDRVLAKLATESRRRALAVGCAVVIVALLAARTHARNRDYHSEFDMIYSGDLEESYMILANHYLARDLLSDARREATVLLERGGAGDRDRAFAHFLLGFVHEREGDYEGSAREFRAVIEIMPDFAYAHTELGAALMRVDEVDAAAAQFERAIELAPTSAQAHVELGIARLHQGRHDDAVREFERALELEPIHAEAHNELGQLLVERDEGALARDHFEEALRLDPDMEDARDNLLRLDGLDSSRPHGDARGEGGRE